MKFVLLLIVEVLQNFGDEIIDSRTRKEGIGCGREQGAQRHTDRQRQRQRESLARFALCPYDTRDQEPDEQQVRVPIGSRRRMPIALYVTFLSLSDHGGFLLFQLLMKPGKELKTRSFKLLKNWPR